MKPTPFNGIYSLNRARQRPVVGREDSEANYAYLGTQDSNLHRDDFSFYFNLLKRRKWCIILTTFLITFAVILYAIFEAKIYVASTKILIEDDSPHILNIKELTIPDKSKNFFQTEYKLIQISENIEEIIDRLQLDKEDHSEKYVFMKKIGDLIESASGILSSLQNALLRAVTPTSESSVTPLLDDAAKHRHQAITSFYKSLKVDPQEDTKLVDIRISGPDPQLVAQEANMLAEIYIRKNLEKKLEVNRKAQAWLTDQTEELEKQMRDAELKLQKLRAQKRFISLDAEEKRDLLLTTLNEINSEYNKTLSDRINIEARLSNGEDSYNKDDLETMPLSENSTYIQIKQKLLSLKDEYAKLSNTYKSDHPVMVQKRFQMDEIRKNIREESKKLTRSTKAEYNILRTKELALEKEVNKKKDEAIKLDEDMITYNALKRDTESYRKLYSEASQRLREIKLTQAQTTSNVTVVEKASVPIQPVSSKTSKVLLGALLGCSIGIGLAFIRDYCDASLKGIDEVEHYLQIPCLSVIPSGIPGIDHNIAYSSYLRVRQEPLSPERKSRSWTSTLLRGATSDRRRDRSLIPHRIATLYHRGSTILEAYNLLRTRLLSPASDIKTLLVTSAVPAEGKSTTISYLGMAFARLGRRVLLVDTDLRQPALHRRFRVHNNAGLTDILAQGHDWQQFIQNTSLAYLQILPAGGGPHGYPSDVLSLATMQKLVEDLRNDFDLVIFDAPPILSLPDAEILVPAVDGVLLVHSPGKCSKEDVFEATRVLQRAGANVFGVVLNDVSSKEQRYYYGVSHPTA